MGRTSLRISIRYKLFAGITLLIVAMTAAIGTVMINRQKEQYLDQLTQFGVYVASYLAQTSAEPLLFGDELAMTLLIKDVVVNPQVTQVMIVDKAGMIRAHNSVDRLGSVYMPAEREQLGKELGKVSLYYLVKKGEPILEFSSPIVYQDTPVGKVYLNLTRSFIDKEIAKARWFVIGLALALMVVGALLSLVMSTALLRPIRSLVSGTREIANGNFDYHVEVLRNDEMGDLAESFNKMAHDLHQKQIIEDSFGRYVSPEIANLILNNPDEVWMVGTKREVSLFFADIRGFTSLTEKKPPEELLAVLNGFFSVATEVIVQHKGYINKFVGDEVMAVFGAPVADADHPDNTIRALLELRERIEKFNHTEGAKHNIMLGVGMGATVGQVIAGNVGSQTRMEYTVMGDNVNVASRLTQMASADEILISNEFYERVHSLINAETVGPVQVKGRERWVMVHRVLSLKNGQNNT